MAVSGRGPRCKGWDLKSSFEGLVFTFRGTQLRSRGQGILIRIKVLG